MSEDPLTNPEEIWYTGGSSFVMDGKIRAGFAVVSSFETIEGKRLPPGESESESRSVMSDSLQPHGLYVHGILQARILEWVAFPFSRESSQPRDRTQVFRIAGRFFTSSVVEDFGVLLAVG